MKLKQLKTIIREEVTKALKEQASEITDMMSFKKALEDHNWHYEKEDSTSKYMQGKTEHEALIKAAKTLGPEAIKLYNTELFKWFPKDRFPRIKPLA